MIHFNLIDLVEKQVQGEGYYKRVEKDLYIEAADSKVTKAFVEIIRDKKIISGIHFKGLEADGAFGGAFMVSEIKGNSIYLKKI